MSRVSMQRQRAPAPEASAREPSKGAPPRATGRPFTPDRPSDPPPAFQMTHPDAARMLASDPPGRGGQPLHPAIRASMEHQFRADFSRVRLHTDPGLAPGDADAMTRGEHIHLGPGAGDLGDPAGRALLAHELTHVLQQRASRVPATARAAGLAVNDDPALELAAEQAGEAVAAGNRPALPAPLLSAPAGPAEPGAVAQMGHKKKAARTARRQAKQASAAASAAALAAPPPQTWGAWFRDKLLGTEAGPQVEQKAPAWTGPAAAAPPIPATPETPSAPELSVEAAVPWADTDTRHLHRFGEDGHRVDLGVGRASVSSGVKQALSMDRLPGMGPPTSPAGATELTALKLQGDAALAEGASESRGSSLWNFLHYGGSASGRLGAVEGEAGAGVALDRNKQEYAAGLKLAAGGYAAKGTLQGDVGLRIPWTNTVVGLQGSAGMTLGAGFEAGYGARYTPEKGFHLGGETAATLGLGYKAGVGATVRKADKSRGWLW